MFAQIAGRLVQFIDFQHLATEGAGTAGFAWNL
jgi:hypothetical protein